MVPSLLLVTAGDDQRAAMRALLAAAWGRPAPAVLLVDLPEDPPPPAPELSASLNLELPVVIRPPDQSSPSFLRPGAEAERLAASRPPIRLRVGGWA